VTSDGIINVVKALKLTLLDISGCVIKDHAIVNEMIPYLELIQSLNISDCVRLTAEQARQLIRLGPEIPPPPYTNESLTIKCVML
jgi:hypothetical protein